MIIEFIGASGSGKTAISSAILRNNWILKPARKSLAHVAGRTRGLQWAAEVPGLTFVPGFLVRLMRAPRGVRMMWRNSPRKKCRAAVRLACRNQFLSTFKSVYVFDQGLIQGLVSLTRSWRAEERANCLGDLYSLFGERVIPNLIVSINVTPEEAASRTKMGNPIHKNINQIESLFQCIAAHVDLLRELYAVPVLTISNHNGIEDAVARLRQVNQDAGFDVEL